MKQDTNGWVKYIHKTYPTRDAALTDEGNMTDGHLGNGLCLNRSRGGKSWQILTRKGMTHTEETKRIISEKAKARGNPTEAATQAAAIANTGRKQDPVHTATIKAKLTAYYAEPEHRAKLAARNPMKNKSSRDLLAASKSGLKHCHNPETGTRKYFRDILPEGFVPGWPNWAPRKRETAK